jgi:hypothetical protein
MIYGIGDQLLLYKVKFYQKHSQISLVKTRKTINDLLLQSREGFSYKVL